MLFIIFHGLFDIPFLIAAYHHSLPASFPFIAKEITFSVCQIPLALTIRREFCIRFMPFWLNMKKVNKIMVNEVDDRMPNYTCSICSLLTFYLPASSADNLCKQFYDSSGLIWVQTV